MEHAAPHPRFPQGIANGSLTVGDAVLFVTLMQQLYGPLNFFGTCARRRRWGGGGAGEAGAPWRAWHASG